MFSTSVVYLLAHSHMVMYFCYAGMLMYMNFFRQKAFSIIGFNKITL